MDKRGNKAELHLAATLNRIYGNYWDIIARSFVSGIFVGLGATIGFALLLYILIYVLDVLTLIPGAGDFFQSAKNFFDQFSGRELR